MKRRLALLVRLLALPAVMFVAGFVATGGWAESPPPGEPGGSFSSPVEGTVVIEGPSYSIPVKWTASCPLPSGQELRYHHWTVAILVTRSKDGEKAIGQSLEYVGVTDSSKGPQEQGMVVTLAPGVQMESFDVKVTVLCYDKTKEIGNTSVTLCLAPKTVSDAELDSMRAVEKFRAKMYDNDKNENGNCTIGYGHKIHDGLCECNKPPDVHQACRYPKELGFAGLTLAEAEKGITQAEAEKLFAADVAEHARLIKGYAAKGKKLLNQCQLDALVDFSFNVGLGKGGKLYSWVTDLKSGDLAAIPAEMRKFKTPASVGARHEADAKRFETTDCPC
jgi:GH24 family phage-related lysozyme (muramidase)